jgi:hypothetical protein
MIGIRCTIGNSGSIRFKREFYENERQMNGALGIRSAIFCHDFSR